MNFESLHWRTIKKMVEDKGTIYENREQAEAFLLSLPEEERPVIKMVMLDRSLPVGEIYGVMDECPNARFSQGGHLFDGEGKKVG